jgi:hypothetical protein
MTQPTQRGWATPQDRASRERNWRAILEGDFRSTLAALCNDPNNSRLRGNLRVLTEAVQVWNRRCEDTGAGERIAVRIPPALDRAIARAEGRDDRRPSTPTPRPVRPVKVSAPVGVTTLQQAKQKLASLDDGERRARKARKRAKRLARLERELTPVSAEAVAASEAQDKLRRVCPLLW